MISIEIAFDKNSISIHKNNSQQTRYRKELTQHDKGPLQ